MGRKRCCGQDEAKVQIPFGKLRAGPRFASLSRNDQAFNWRLCSPHKQRRLVWATRGYVETEAEMQVLGLAPPAQDDTFGSMGLAISPSAARGGGSLRSGRGLQRTG